VLLSDYGLIVKSGAVPGSGGQGADGVPTGSMHLLDRFKVAPEVIQGFGEVRRVAPSRTRH
jgi:hypothetical protein